MSAPLTTCTFHSAEDTAKSAADLGAVLVPGDVILLTGDVGAGKTHFARALIQSLLFEPEDVPSPTFTLVQTYDTLKGEIWHADLYRLTSTAEIEELGLSDAFENAVCLIEWPDRLGDLRPDGALELTLTQAGQQDARHLTCTWDGDGWNQRVKAWLR